MSWGERVLLIGVLNFAFAMFGWRGRKSINLKAGGGGGSVNLLGVCGRRKGVRSLSSVFI